MNTFFRFFYEFISVFIDGCFMIFKGIIDGIKQMFDFGSYGKVIESYKDSFNGNEQLFVAMTVIIIAIVVILLGLLFFFLIRKIIRKVKGNFTKDELLNEIGNLNQQVRKLMKEKEEIMAMKVSQLGVNPEEEQEDTANDSEEEEDLGIQGIRFPKLTALDEKYANYKIKRYDNNFTLEELN